MVHAGFVSANGADIVHVHEHEQTGTKLLINQHERTRGHASIARSGTFEPPHLASGKLLASATSLTKRPSQGATGFKECLATWSADFA